MTRYTVFLRGIKVGKNKQIGMADLRALLNAEGFETSLLCYRVAILCSTHRDPHLTWPWL